MAIDDNEINENIKSLLNDVHKKDNSEDNIEDLKSLELAKIIVRELLSVDNVKSLSILNQEQIEDITNAYLLNTYYQIPDIDKYILDFLTLKRSTSGYLIDKISSLSTNQGFEGEMQKQSLINRVFRR